MDITRDRKLEKKKSARTSEKSSRDNTDQQIDHDTYTLEDGRTVKMAPDLKDLPEFDWDDPQQKKWAEDQMEKWQKRHPNLTQAELDHKIDEILESEKELRKKSQY
jgi:hypothetical protein